MTTTCLCDVLDLRSHIDDGFLLASRISVAELSDAATSLSVSPCFRIYGTLSIARLIVSKRRAHYAVAVGGRSLERWVVGPVYEWRRGPEQTKHTAHALTKRDGDVSDEIVRILTVVSAPSIDAALY